MDPGCPRVICPDWIQEPASLPFTSPRSRGGLPHLQKAGCTYFVTFCLYDAASARGRQRKRLEGDDNPGRLAQHFEPSPSSGSCVLADEHIAAVVERALLHFQGQRYALSAWCVMPNHVHVVVTPYPDHTLSNTLHSWKSFSAHEINRLLHREGPLWQKESFDHLVRDQGPFERFVVYTEANPVEAGLCRHPGHWPFSSARLRGVEE
jgi:REP element-mobilizing transposase RayT